MLHKHYVHDMSRIISILLIFSWILPANSQPANREMKRLQYNHPGLVVDLGVGLWAWPIPMDYDNDGDMDLLVSSQGKPYNGTYLFENTSGDKIPVFAKAVRLGNSIKDIQVSYIDGKQRITVPGAELTQFLQKMDSVKKELFPANTALKDIKGKNRFNQWKLVDYDNDGDIDILIGVDDWTDYGWDNAYNSKGIWTNGPLHGYVYLVENEKGIYVNKGRLQVRGRDLDVYGAPTPNIADFDGDGDLDLICGEFIDRLTYFENTGTREKPVYAPGKYLENESGIITMQLEMIIPVAVDWNKDGFTDLVVGDEDGRVALIEHTGKIKKGMPVFKSPYYFKQEADEVKFGVLATPVGIDWNGDGREDIVTGNSAGQIAFIENLGGQPVKWAAPQLLKADGKTIRIQAGDNGSIQGPAEKKWGYTTLSVADWNQDGLPDLIVNSIWGKIIWYENKGSKKQPILKSAKSITVEWKGDPPKPEWNWWNPVNKELVTQWRTSPVAIDWTGDGLTDLVMLDHEGYLALFRREKTKSGLQLLPGERVFRIEGKDSALRMNEKKAGGSGRRQLSAIDLDGDGRLDLLVNSENATIYRNKGNRNGITIFRDEGPVHTMILTGHATSPNTIDTDGDGKREILIGAEDGFFYHLKL